MAAHFFGFLENSNSKEYFEKKLLQLKTPKYPNYDKGSQIQRDLCGSGLN